MECRCCTRTPVVGERVCSPGRRIFRDECGNADAWEIEAGGFATVVEVIDDSNFKLCNAGGVHSWSLCTWAFTYDLTFPTQLQRIGRGCASDEERQAACTRLASMLAAVLHYDKGDKDGQQFFGKQLKRLRPIDEKMSHLLPFAEKLKVTIDNDTTTAVECAESTRAEFETIVAATICCPSWKTAWLNSLINLVTDSYQTCSLLIMEAIKGGVETDMEIRAIEEVMWLLGFTVAEHKPGFRAQMNDRYIQWTWRMQRPGANPFTVALFQCVSIDEMAVEKIAWDLRPREDAQKAPNLKRCAIVSCPLHGPDDRGGYTRPVHDELNKKLVDGMDICISMARKNGWHERSTWGEPDTWA